MHKINHIIEKFIISFYIEKTKCYNNSNVIFFYRFCKGFKMTKIKDIIKKTFKKLKSIFTKIKRASSENHVKNEKAISKKEKKPAEKRLFHKPITASKIVKYCLLAASIAALVLLFRFLYVTVLNPRAAFDSTAASVQTTTEETATATSTPDTTTAIETYSPEELLEMQADTDFMKDRVNILLTGIDYSEEREGRTDFRTDTILLVSIDFSTGQADMLSIPRDSYADIAFTDDKWKINGAYMSAGGADGEGFECLMQTVSDTIGGIPVTYYVAVEMQAVKDIVDIIGGVWYDVDYEIDMNDRHLDTGYQLLDGQAVLDYCRARKGITSGTDIDRIDRQQRLLMEVFNQMKSASTLQKIPEIYQTMESQIYTNLNFEQIVALTLFALDLDLETECDRYTLKGEYMKAYNATYYVLDHTYTQEVIMEIFGVEADIDWTYSIDYVKKDMAKRSLSSAIDKVSSLVANNQDILTAEQIADANAKLSSARSVLSNQKTSDMNSATSTLNTLYDTLYAYIQNPPEPTAEPTIEPTAEPTIEPTAEPTIEPTAEPTIEPTAEPTIEPTTEPTAETESSVEPT